MNIAKDFGNQILRSAPTVAPGAAAAYFRRILDVAVDGYANLPGARVAAGGQLQKYGDVDKAIDALMRQHITMAGVQGFATNVGGLATLAVAVPANITGAAVLQCRLSAAIAHLRGYDVNDARVRSAVLMCLLGEANATALIESEGLPSTPMGIATAPVFDAELHNNISEKVLGHLLAQIGGKRATLLAAKRVPVLGGGIGAVTDGASTWSVASYARSQFVNRRHIAK